MLSNMFSRSWLTLARAVLSASVVAACGGPTFIVQQYDGPPREPETIAVLRVNGDANVVLLSLDGESIRTRVADDARLHVEMLPGVHRVAIADLVDETRPVGRAAFTAEAGKVYRPVFADPREGGARVIEVDRSGDTEVRDATLRQNDSPMRTNTK